MNSFAITQFILGATIFGIALLIIFVLTQNTKPKTNRALLAQLIGTLCWTCGIFINLWQKSEFVERFIFASVAMTLAAQLYFVHIFPESERKGPRTRYFIGCALGLGSAFGIASFIPGSVFSSILVTQAGYTIVHPGWFSSCYAAFVFTYIVLAIVLLFRTQKNLTDTTLKSQARSLLWGFIVFFITNLFTNSILPVFFDIYFFNGIGPSFSLAFVGFVVYIVYRHNFLEIRRALQRGFVFTILLSLIVGLYSATLLTIGRIASGRTEATILVSAGLTMILGIFLFPHIEAYLRRTTDHFFFKDRYNYAKALYGLSEKVNKSMHVEDIERLTESELRKIFKTGTVTIDARRGDDSSYLITPPHEENDRVTLTIPIVLDGIVIGTIFLGEKLSGDVYSDEDVVLIKTFSHQIAVAFEKARLLKEVQDYSEELERRVIERTRQISELQEAQTHMMLDISHKLQNPLTIIKAEISHLRKLLPETHALSLFEKTIDDTSRFTYDLLHLARLDIISESLLKERVNMSDHIRELIEYFEIVAEHERIQIFHTIAPNIIFSCNKEKMTELITNLVSNAMKYMGPLEEKERRITISLSEEKGAIRLSIEDSGVGIRSDDLPHIFKRFYRTKGLGNMGIEGAGLGLAISKRIVDIHGGTITVSSTVNEGTTFVIDFPV